MDTNKEKSYVSAEDILNSANSIARPVEVPNAIVGYIADLIIVVAKAKVKKVTKSQNYK